MSSISPKKLTFGNVQEYLRRLGFTGSAAVNRSLTFHHPETDTIVVLSIPEDGQSLRDADLLSIWMRLDAAGLMSERDLKQFKSGQLPMAS